MVSKKLPQQQTLIADASVLGGITLASTRLSVCAAVVSSKASGKASRLKSVCVSVVSSKAGGKVSRRVAFNKRVFIGFYWFFVVGAAPAQRRPSAGRAPAQRGRTWPTPPVGALERPGPHVWFIENGSWVGFEVGFEGFEVGFENLIFFIGFLLDL